MNNLKRAGEPFTLLAVGPRRSGKSTFNTMLLKNGLTRRFEKIYVFNPSTDVNHDFDAFRNNKKFTFITPKDSVEIDRIFDEATEEKKLVQSINRGETILAPGKRRKVAQQEILIIFDDCIDSQLLRFTGPADKIAERGRHVGISAIFTTQRLSACSRSIRLNSDIIVLWSPFSMSELQQFVEQYVWKEDRKWLKVFLNQLYEVAHNFIVIDNFERNVNKKLKFGNAESFIKNSLKLIHSIKNYGS